MPAFTVVSTAVDLIFSIIPWPVYLTNCKAHRGEIFSLFPFLSPSSISLLNPGIDLAEGSWFRDRQYFLPYLSSCNWKKIAFPSSYRISAFIWILMLILGFVRVLCAWRNSLRMSHLFNFYYRIKNACGITGRGNDEAVGEWCQTHGKGQVFMVHKRAEITSLSHLTTTLQQLLIPITAWRQYF